MMNHRLLSAVLLFAGLAVCPAGAEPVGWSIEPETVDPRYAVVEPAETNLNISAIVLSCEQTNGARLLQLQLYLTDDGPLRAKATSAGRPKVEPRAELLIDGHAFPVSLMFADTYAVVADDHDGPYPKLSDHLVAALQSGETMTLHLDLLAEPSGEPAAFDGAAVVPLSGSGGHRAIAAMRRCAGPTNLTGSGLAQLGH
ncbi:MAG: hypothetical protein AB7F22_02725 [Reyranella sp.]|uniref:hypothetical protein n=1 Tax=Reyranella sp. TaxID=1929291 RepID=UPI003D0AD989